jgi:hypothetical protein
MDVPDGIVQQLTRAHQEALRVGDSPLAADRLADRLGELARSLASRDLTEEQRGRIGSALANAERVLRRDDDGREAAKHLQSALRLTETRPRKPSPFLDD